MPRRPLPPAPLDLARAFIADARAASSAAERRAQIDGALRALNEARAQLRDHVDAVAWCEERHPAAVDLIRAAVDKRCREIELASEAVAVLERGALVSGT